MNGNPLLALIVTCLLACMACFSILLGEGNVLANLFLYLIFGGALLALVNPRLAFFVVLISSAYVDMVKRLMVVSDRVQMQDLYYVLGFTPLTFGMVTLALFCRGMIGGKRFQTDDIRRLLAAGMIAMLNIALLVVSAGPEGGGLKEAANGGLYAMILFVVPILFPKSDDMLRLFKVLLWIFAPVALYGITQLLWGFRDFEIYYLQTGLSIEIKQLFTDRVRAFSTLNSPTSLGTICAVFTVIPLFLAGQRSEAGRRHLSPALALLMTLVFFTGLGASTSRTGYLLIAISGTGYLCFTSRVRTLTFYALSGVVFIAMLLSARFLQDRLDNVTQALFAFAGDYFSEETLTVNTFSDRLQGFAQVLTNPDAYTLFGHGPTTGKDPTDPLYHHDLFSGILVSYGVLALFTVAVLGAFFLWVSHRSLLGIKDPGKRKIGAMMLALAMGLVAISGVSGNVLSIFPVNILFWLVVSAAMMAVRAPQTVAATAQPPPKPYQPRKGMHRLAPHRKAPLGTPQLQRPPFPQS
jgi:hypothetical protein